MYCRLSATQRLLAVILISFCFCILELSIGFWTSSLALIADGFHVTNDLIGFIIAFFATKKINDSEVHPSCLTSRYTFGWQRAEILGAFFNGAFLFALSVSILLQSIGRFLQPTPLERPLNIIVVGGVGLALNLLSLLAVHDHGHCSGHTHSAENIKTETTEAMTTFSERGDSLRPTFCAHEWNQFHAEHEHESSKRQQVHRVRNLNTMGVVMHLIGDVFGNVVVILSALVYIKTRFVYADTMASVCVGLVIMSTSIPLMKRSGKILLEAGPEGIDISLVIKDISQAHNVAKVAGIHVWQLNQTKVLATVDITLSNGSLQDFRLTQRQIKECMSRWGIQQVNIQPVFQEKQLLTDFSQSDNAISEVPESLAALPDPLPYSKESNPKHRFNSESAPGDVEQDANAVCLSQM